MRFFFRFLIITNGQKKRQFFELSEKPKSTLLMGVRNAYLHLYRNCDNIAKKYKNNTVKCLQSWT